MIQIKFEDNLTPFLKRIIAEKPQWMGSALKSAGYWSQQQIKKGIKSGAPGGAIYAPLMPVWIRRKIEIELHGTAAKNYNPMGKLANAVGYDKTKANDGIVTVGWLSKSAVLIGTKQELGFFNTVTQRMREAFAAAGHPISEDKKVIQVIARPTYKPMQPILQVGAPKKVEEKIIAYINGASRRSAASSDRVYKVYT